MKSLTRDKQLLVILSKHNKSYLDRCCAGEYNARFLSTFKSL